MYFFFQDDDGDGRTDEDCSATSCRPTVQVVGDRIDNDCDSRIDEEICDGNGEIFEGLKV